MVVVNTTLCTALVLDNSMRTSDITIIIVVIKYLVCNLRRRQLTRRYECKRFGFRANRQPFPYYASLFDILFGGKIQITNTSVTTIKRDVHSKYNIRINRFIVVISVIETSVTVLALNY